MFAQPTGKPIDPRRDQYEWKALLKEADVREARLHDARHTAATSLLLLGVPERAVMDVMGWSNAAMVKRYAHVTAKQLRYLAAALKAPRITETAQRLAKQARDAGWTHEDYLAAVLEREVSARSASGAQLRIRAAEVCDTLACLRLTSWVAVS